MSNELKKKKIQLVDAETLNDIFDLVSKQVERQ